MAKKKSREEETVQAPLSDITPSADATDDASQEPSGISHPSSVVEEVQAFLAQRAELAKRLADEIEATERKLSELKKTAAMLFPENASAVPKEKKAKKTIKPKPLPRQEEPTSEPETRDTTDA